MERKGSSKGKGERGTIAPSPQTPSNPAMLFEEEEKYEREDIQKKTFAKWINSQLVKGQHPPVTDLFYDLRDGTRLLALLEVLTGKTYKREKGRMRVHHLNNVSRALAVLEENSVKLVNISNEHIVDGSAKLTLGLVWAVILHWQVQGVLKDVMSDLQQTNLEKTLLAWCRQNTKSYPNVDIKNFTSSWSDGLAFNALLHSHRPHLFEWTVVARKHPYARLENAFRIANEHLGIERLLDPEDVNASVPDKKSIMMYVMCLFQALPHEAFTVDTREATMELEGATALPTQSLSVAAEGGKGRPLSAVSIGLGGYQRTLEEVLSWLLGAEDRLAAMPPIADSTDAVKEQFHDLEELMLDLTAKQGGIGDVLGEGSRLLREGVMEDEEEEEVRVQMKLLNTRWEELRVRAMERQSRLHEKLMTLQEKQLDGLKKWLTETEDRIANMSQVGPTTDALRQQVESHQQLQHDLEAEQSNINSLSNMVVVVDETNSDSVYSSLEDELNALGERWAHICRWTESRWSTLQTLSLHWPRYEEELAGLKEWLQVKERMLREFESEPAKDEAQILRHASLLQVVEAERGVQQRRFDSVQDLSSKILIHIPVESPAHHTIPAHLEDAQDSLDLLTSIVEAQTTRLAASGIDIQKVVVPVEECGGGGEVMSSSTTTITTKDAASTLITKIITTKMTETVSLSGAKRQKLEGGSQGDFKLALTKLGEWMDGVEGKTRSGEVEELSLQQLHLLHQHLEAEVESQREEYSKVVSLGESVISESSTIGESSMESCREVEAVTLRWEALGRMLEDIRHRLTFMATREEVKSSLCDLKKKLKEVEEWKVEDKEVEFKTKVEEVEQLRTRVEELDDKWVEKQVMVEEVEDCLAMWRKLRESFQQEVQVEEMDFTPIPTPTPPTPPTEPLLQAVASCRACLESLEGALDSGNGAVIQKLPIMEARLKELKELKQKATTQQPNIELLASTSSTLKEEVEGVREDVARLTTQWETTTRTLDARIRVLEEGVKRVSQYEDEVSGLKSWLAEVEVFLKAEEAALGDIDTLEAQLEQSNALQDDITTLTTNMSSITTTGTQLVEEAKVETSGGVEDEGYSTTLSNDLEDLRQRWEAVTQLAILQNRSLKEAMEKSKKVHKDIQDLTAYLDDLEGRLPPPPPPTTTTTTNTITTNITTLSELKEEMREREKCLKALDDIAGDMLSSDFTATHEDLAKQFMKLKARWTDVSGKLETQLKELSDVMGHFEEFDKLCKEEDEWLRQLEGKLEVSYKDTADAEEISETLDELDIFLHTHNEERLDRIRRLGEVLSETVLAEGVKGATSTLTARFSTLSTKASEKQSGLEGRIQEAQAWEREYVSVLDLLAKTDATLTLILAGEGQRLDMKEIEDELMGQRGVLSKMREQVGIYREEGKSEAAIRLEDQLTHLQHKYEEATLKLQLCQKPSEYDLRLQRAEESLRKIEAKVEQLQLTSSSPEEIQEQLTQCMALYQSLSEVKGEVEEVIATGRRMVKEGECCDPADLTLKLDEVKALYNQLGGGVTEQRGALERALRHTRKLSKESQQLEEWLVSTERELDQREASVPIENIQQELHFVQHALEDLCRRKPLLVGVQEGAASLCKEQGSLPELEEKIGDLTLTWERVNTRLNNRLKNLQSEQALKEAEMENFIIGLGEVKGWLESTEKKLKDLDSLPHQERERIVKGAWSEVEDYKGQIQSIQHTGQALITHEVLFEDKIQPELKLIKDRWERIHDSLQKQEEMSVAKTYVRETRTTTTTANTTTTELKEEKEEEEEEEGKDMVELYLSEVTKMSDKVTALTNATNTPAPYHKALQRMQSLEGEVIQLEPDVATVISRGDTLTLTTHTTDVQRAHNIRVAVNDLRNQWGNLKVKTEALKVEADQVVSDVDSVSGRANSVLNWCNEAVKRFQLANNDESQMQVLETEMGEKRKELDALNESGQLLKKYQYSQIQPALTLLNMRWTEIAMQFRQFKKDALDKTGVMETTTTSITTLLAQISTVRDAISAVSKQMGVPQLTSATPYQDLSKQEQHLKSVKQDLSTLKPQVDEVEEEREVLARQGGGVLEEEVVRKAGDKLREEWAQINRAYTERHTKWLECSEKWMSLNKTVDEFGVWMSGAEERLRSTSTYTLAEWKAVQKELEKQVTLKHRPSQSIQSTCKEVVDGLPVDEGKRLQEKVDDLMKRWKTLLVDLAARRERIAGEETKESLKEVSEVKDSAIHSSIVTSGVVVVGAGVDYDGLLSWVEQVEALTSAPVNVTDEASLSAHFTMVQNHVQGLPGKQSVMTRLREQGRGPNAAQITALDGRVNKLSQGLPDYRDKVETKLGVIKTLGQEVEDIYRWTEEMRVKVALRSLSQDEVKVSQNVLREKEAMFENLDTTFWVLAQDVEGKGLNVSLALKNRISTIESRLKALETQLLEESEVSAVGKAPPTVGSTVTANVTSVIKDVMKFEETVLREGQEERPPFPVVTPPRDPQGASPILILASLDKSILQIRDWLTLIEQMSRQQTVEVGDEDNIRRLTEKQKNVLRELEGKKPQLDDLVTSADGLKEDASRTQLHQKVSKLREHWDETNSVVLARKTQLDAMLGDTHKFDAKRAELEAWLGRMEARLERMGPIARTADVLDQQIREQKGFHAEIHQYKHQLELFNQMTQRLIAVYQHDDTRRLKKITETVNFRYSSLNASIIARGKELHSAINSLHNFDKALDKFASWISDMESGSEVLEGEVDKLGPPPSLSSTRGHHHPHHPSRTAPALHLKDLQSEIESHKDVLASLNATGQKLLGTLENQEEAVMLQRRLEEMNHRWNTLKHKSIAIRNRLEGNSENWTTLLLSLRELIEWVIRKDTELTALGPLVGDILTLTKYSEDIAAFKRVIEEKQPVIESNLKSGRQLIASEPPLSDTSDSEAGRELDGDARYRGDETARDLTRAVRREVAKLSEKWAALRERVAAITTHTDLALKKLGVLQKTVQEVSQRVEEAERVVGGWGGVPQDSNLADQHAHNVKKFREGLVELQRGVDDVNDQAARFSAHSVPLTPANSAKLHDLNSRWKNVESCVNERWRQVAGRSREVTPLTPAQLASSVSPPWERATTSNKVPYYINHDQESTHWDHPVMMDVLDSLTQFNHIKFSAYRTATKLRVLQKKLGLDRALMQTATDIFDEQGLRGQNDRLIDIGDIIIVLSALYGSISADNPDLDITLAMDLCLNWLLNVYDSQRTGQMRVLSFKIGLVCLCMGHLEEKYKYMFRLIADPNRLVDQRKLGLLLHDCVQVPRQLGEVAAFGGSNIEPSVRSCFTKAGKDRDTIEALHFLAWVQQEPQSLVWLAVLHRVAASESIQHQVKCNICKAYPILGLRYRCLKCLSFDMCQDCFFDGRSTKSHKITHPMHEYCTATTAGEDVKDFTKALKNKFKSKRSLQKHTKKGYLPVQTVLEGDPLESPSPSPQHNVSSQDMHSRLEMYASRLAEVELRTNSNSTPDSEDEHGLIAQYCQSLSSSDAPLPVPRSPLQIMAAVDADQKDELEQMIRALEEENSVLQAEYDRLKSQQPVGSPPEDGLGQQRSEAEMLAEAKLLRQHKGRLEARMGILEEHNRQLEAQLHRLRQLLGESGGLSSPSKSNTLQTKSVTASQLAMDSPAKINGHANQGDLGRAVGSLVATMNQEQGSALPSEEEEEEEEKVVSPPSQANPRQQE